MTKETHRKGESPTSDTKKCCGNCRRFADECAEGCGWCELRNKKTSCDAVCDSHEWRYDSFSQRCMDLPYGFDHTLCEGNKCGHRRKCVRYMLHVKKRLTATPGAAFYMVCAPKYNFALCFWNYYEKKKKKQ